MGLGLLYWISWILALLGGLLMATTALWPTTLAVVGLLIMTFLLGYKVFGWPLTGATE